MVVARLTPARRRRGTPRGTSVIPRRKALDALTLDKDGVDGKFDADPGVQGFASGLCTDPDSSAAGGTEAEQRARLLHCQDLIEVGLTGNLAHHAFTDSAGKQVKGSDVDHHPA